MLSVSLAYTRHGIAKHDKQEGSTANVRGKWHKCILLPMSWRRGRLAGRAARIRSQNPAGQNETIEAVWSAAKEKKRRLLNRRFCESQLKLSLREHVPDTQVTHR